MRLRFLHAFLLFLNPWWLGAQTTTPSELKAQVYWNHSANSLEVNSTLSFQKEAFSRSNTVNLYDWNHSFSSKNSPLGLSFQQRFDRSFHLANDDERGLTSDLEITHQTVQLSYRRIDFDVLEVSLPPSFNGDFVELEVNYKLKLPDIKFTGYGIDEQETLWLKNSLVLPIPLESTVSEVYHHFNRGDQHTGLVHYDLTFDRGDNHFIHSDLPSNSFFDFSVSLKIVEL